MESPWPFPPPLSRGSGAIVESSLLHPLLLIKDVKEQLNTHIRKKRLQLMWGLPYIILNSLTASIPSIPEFLECTALLESKAYQRPLFRAERRKHLERHLREKMVHHKWGLPKRIQKSLKWFIPPEAAKQEPMLDEKVPISTSTHTGLCEASCGSSEACTSRICLTAQRSEGSGQSTVTLDTTSETTIAGSMRNLQRCQTQTCPQNKTGEESLLLEWSMNFNPDATELPVIGEKKKKHLEFQGGKENRDLSEDTEGSGETFLLGTSPPSTQPALLNGAQSEIGTSFMDTRFRNNKGQCNQNLELRTKLEMKWGVSYMFQESSPAMRPPPAQLTYWEREPSSGAEKSPRHTGK
ncbi:paired box protein Pax-6-like [Platysternon megacephalum]|uniref:Paired box protein Pax-6-like n=1 Tax=Platysternon megacephalum TaxID=55544 RepID=A0A4D9DP35_9SAUR|nr:paired box protein Pax-6-like [Platysternon megacephalum]